MNIKIWNKIDEINGVAANIILESRQDLAIEEEIILLEKNGVVTNIEIPSILKSNLNLSMDLSAIEAGQAYVNYLIEQEQQQEKDNITLEELKARNEELEACVLELAEMIGNI